MTKGFWRFCFPKLSTTPTSASYAEKPKWRRPASPPLDKRSDVTPHFDTIQSGIPDAAKRSCWVDFGVFLTAGVLLSLCVVLKIDNAADGLWDSKNLKNQMVSSSLGAVSKRQTSDWEADLSARHLLDSQPLVRTDTLFILKHCSVRLRTFSIIQL